MTYESINGILNEVEGMNGNEEIIEINITNMSSGATFPCVRAYGDNTLGQIFAEYAKDIGINPDEKRIVFTNKRTNQSTSDKDMTVRKFGLINGDVLNVQDDLTVAGISEEDESMDYSEEIIEISITNKATGATYPMVRVYGDNTLGQVLEEYAEDIAINPHEKRIVFTNKRTNKSTSDKNMTIAGFGLCSGDVLTACDDSTVAGIAENSDSGPGTPAL